MNATDLHSKALQSELEQLHAASFGWALACCGQRREEAEDVLQTAYIKVLEGKAKFAGRSSFRTWLFGVIRHTALEQRRRRWVREMLLERWFLSRPSSSSGQTVSDVPADNQALRDALVRLPERQQQLLHLVFYQEMTVEEAGAVMGVSIGTARTHFDRGKRRLRQILAPELNLEEKR
jgi:RNA polymerase sigma-70 factor (ECF subfamily)